MKPWLKIIGGVALSLMCLFTSIGYAAISGELKIEGTAEITPPKGLFISQVNGGSYINPDTLAYSGTVVTSTVTLKPNASGVYEAVYTITVFNNTDTTYYYLAMVRGTQTAANGTQEVAYSNKNITMSVSGIKRGDAVSPGARQTFKVTATFDKNAIDKTNYRLSSIIEYRFSTSVPETSDEAAISGVLARFPEILNTPELYNKMKQDMADRNDGRQRGDYIGNVTGASYDDTATIEALFGDSLILNIDGEDKPITVMIKAENIDGSTSTGESYGGLWGINQNGCEITLYMTADTLQTNRGEAVVFAVPFAKDQSTGKWYQLGDVYAGKTKIKGYTSLTNSGTGSFSTGDWEATAKTYKVTDNYSYSVSNGSSISTIVKATDSAATAELRSLIQRAYDIVESGIYFDDKVEQLEALLTKHSGEYTVKNGTVSISGSPTRAKLVPIMKEFAPILKNFD